MVVVAEANDPIEAAIWVDALRDDGLGAESFERGVGAAFGGAATHTFSRFPVLVRSEDYAAARSIIAELGGAARLAPFRSASDERERANSALKLVGAIAALIAVLSVVAWLT